MMKILLKFAIENRECSILKNSENDANRYINDLTRTLKSKNLLTSMKREKSGVYHYSLINNDVLVTKQPVSESTKYRLAIYVDNVRQAECYKSNSFDALKARVHKTLDSLNYDPEQIDDICGQWSIIDKDRDIKFSINIVDDSGHATSYFDPLSAVRIDSGATLLQHLDTSANSNLKPDLLIKYPHLRTTARVVATIFSAFMITSSLLGYNGVYGILCFIMAIAIVITKLIYRSYETNSFCKAVFRIPTNTIIVITIVNCLTQLYKWSTEANPAFRYNWISITISSIMGIGFIHVLYLIATSDYKSLKKNKKDTR